MSAVSGYRLVPEDVWFFRDGKPSVQGEDHYLRSIFPPFPPTVFGLVRTTRLLEEGLDLGNVSKTWWNGLREGLRTELGEWEGFGTLALRGPWLVRDGQILLPAPADLVLRMKEDTPEFDDPKDAPQSWTRIEAVLRLLPCEAPDGSKWSHPLQVMSPHELQHGLWAPWSRPKDERDPEPSRGWFVTTRGMQSWMDGAAPAPNELFAARELWVDEPRTGVGLREDQRAHKDGQLFTFGFIRLRQGVSLGFELRGGSVGWNQVARFGGENRLARIEKGLRLSDAFSEDQSLTGSCVVTLLTPAIFGGSAPDAGVRAAVVADRELVGGWDLAARHPKALRRAAPAGSVYWLDHGSPSFRSERQEEGFGLMLAGREPRRSHG